MPVINIHEFSGINVHDPAFTLAERSHALTQGGMQQYAGIGTEFADLSNMSFYGRGPGKRKGSVLESTVNTVLSRFLVGSELNIATVGAPALAALSATQIAFIDSTNSDLRTYDFNISTGVWSQVGNDLVIAGLGVPSLAALSATRVAYIDAGNKDLRVYDFDGTDWTQTGNDLNIVTANIPVIAALSATRVAYIDIVNDDLRAYDFDGTNWVQVGNDLVIAGVNGPALTAMSANRIAFIDEANENLQTYDFDGTNWVQVGNNLSVPVIGFPVLAAMSATDVAFIDSTNDDLRLYRFDDTNWTEVGTELNIATSGNPALAALSVTPGSPDATDVAFIDDTNDDLRTYRIKSSRIVVGISWREPTDGSENHLLLTNVTILLKQSSGAWTQINDSAGALYVHDSIVSKGTFAKGDGHIFIGMDGAANEIQTYREGADLDPEMKNANLYEDAYGGTTHAMTGTWPTGAFLVAFLNSRLCFSDGNTVVEYTPMAHTASSGIWDLLGSTAGFKGSGLEKQSTGRIIAMANFVPDLANSIEQTLFVNTEAGWEYLTGFQSYDKFVAFNGSGVCLNHQSFCISKSWIIYLTEDKNIRAVNKLTDIDLGRRFKRPGDEDGPLDGMDIATSRVTSYAFYDKDREQAQLAISTATGRVNDRILVVDMKKGEPIPGEPQNVYERRVRCLPYNIGTPDTNDWFIHVYLTSSGPVGILQSGSIYTLESGFSDLGTIAIAVSMTFPQLTGGAPFIHIDKLWAKAYLRFVANAAVTMNIEVRKNYSATAATGGSFTSVIAADTGDVAKMTRDVDQYGESLQVHISNAQDALGFVLQSAGVEYEHGVEQRG